MSMNTVIQKVDRYLKKDFVQPLIIDVQNPEDLQAIRQHYHVGKNTFVSASKYCGKDAGLQMDRLYSELLQFEGTLFMTGLSVYFKLEGEQFLRDNLKTLLALTVKGHVVILTYQCRKFLTFNDPRLATRIIIVEGKEGRHPSLTFASEEYKSKQKSGSLVGIESLSSLEEMETDNVYVYTQKRKSSFPRSLIYISDLNKAYDVLCNIDHTTSRVPESFGTEAQWGYALNQFDGKNNWPDVINAHFGSSKALNLAIQSYSLYDPEERWLYFIGLKLFGCPNNWCIQAAANAAVRDTEFVKQIYRCILSVAPSDDHFVEHYKQRKMVLQQVGNPLDEVVDFCKVVVSKNENAIYYLTDNTQKERELIFALLDKYGEKYGKQAVVDILKLVYPDLASYLAPYNFRQSLLNSYFDQYKYQKVVNRILPEFEEVVTKQADEREYNLILQPRASIVERVEKKGAQLYFVDALGVEYLSFILSQCKKLNLLAKVTVCCSELPSITSLNKEFLDYFADGDYPVVSIKDIDEIKHHGKYNFDYQQTKLPIHLAKELEIINEILEKIKEKLASGTIGKAILISDHGASRLAVIHETETIWEMPEKGVHSGRCCLKSEIDDVPPYATDAGDFWALANYDRFKGGRKANVEVHGGATLEEVTVPIIELTYHPGKIEVKILPADGTNADFNAIPEIEVSFRKKAAVKIYVSADVSDVSLRVDGKIYEAQPMEQNYFFVEMPDIKRPKMYYADVLAGDNTIAEHLPIKVKSEGMGSSGKGIL